jgi:hypothetical protein
MKLTTKVYNLTGQRDNLLIKDIADAARSNSENMTVIAEATRKDSSAMKAIALLGMGFLPATFVAVSLCNKKTNFP